MILIGIELVKRSGNFQSKLGTIKHIPIDDDQLDSVTKLLRVRIRLSRSEVYWHETDAGQESRIERMRKCAALDPRCSNIFEWSICAAPNGDICCLYEPDARIKNRSCEASQVG